MVAVRPESTITLCPSRSVSYTHLDYGKGYQYAHDAADKLTDMQCLPNALEGREYYRPTEQGLEAKYKARLEQIKEWKRQHRNG